MSVLIVNALLLEHHLWSRIEGTCNPNHVSYTYFQNDNYIQLVLNGLAHLNNTNKKLNQVSKAIIKTIHVLVTATWIANICIYIIPVS